MKIEYDVKRNSYILEDRVEVFIDDFDEGRFTIKPLGDRAIEPMDEHIFWNFITYIKKIDRENPGV